MDNILKLVEEISTLNKRSKLLDLSHVGNIQFMQELQFLHTAIEALIDTRQNTDIYNDYGDSIEESIEIAGMLEECYNNEHKRRVRGN